jgi:hypothetical protein
MVCLIASGCGVSPLGGLEGELCFTDDDCAAGSICEREACTTLGLGDTGFVPREGLFFGGLRLETWAGSLEPESESLADFAGFITDLSEQLFPYYAVNAPDATRLEFGRAERNANPVVLSTDFTINVFSMEQDNTGFLVTDVTLMLPVFYSDDRVDVAFDMPLVQASIALSLGALEPGARGGVTLSGALRADDALGLMIRREERDPVSLFVVIGNSPLDVDTDEDGVNDAWRMRWIGTTDLL